MSFGLSVVFTIPDRVLQRGPAKQEQAEVDEGEDQAKRRQDG
jgi:hypothetical protein